MEKLLPWLKEKKTEKNKINEIPVYENTNTEKVSDVNVVDPKVEEFFKDFPSPYREKVVQRFSKREGLNKFDFFRDKAMQHEKRCAMEGIFLEDRREAEELQLEMKKQQVLQERADKPIVELSEWEKKLLPYVPVKHGDTVSYKLSQSVNLSLIGFAIMWVALSRRKQYSYPVYFTRFLMGTCGFISSQVLAVQRFQDSGIFERSSEKLNNSLNVVENSIDEMKNAVNIIRNHMTDFSEKASVENRKK